MFSNKGQIGGVVPDGREGGKELGEIEGGGGGHNQNILYEKILFSILRKKNEK